MATEGSTSGDSCGPAEFYRVLITGFPPKTNKELFVKQRLAALLQGEVLIVSDHGTENAIVTLQCPQGNSCKVALEQDVEAGHIMSLYNLGTLHTTTIMENVPIPLVNKFNDLANGYGVLCHPISTGCFALTGLIDSICNLRAEVDAYFLRSVKRKQPPPSPCASPPIPPPPVVDSAHASTVTPRPPPGMPAHVVPTPSVSTYSTAVSGTVISTKKLSPVFEARSSGIYTGSSSSATIISEHREPSVPSAPTVPSPQPTAYHSGYPLGAVPVSIEGSMNTETFITPSSSPSDDLPSPMPVNPDSRAPSTSSKDKAHSSSAIGSNNGMKATPTSPPGDERTTVFTGFSRDALVLVQRLPEGDIPGIVYQIKEGSVRILLKTQSEIDRAISQFQEAYKNVHGRKLRAENVMIPDGYTVEQVKTEIHNFEEKYLHTAFVLDEEKWAVRVISQSRQFDQAKKFLAEALQQAVPTVTATSDASLVITFHNRQFTLKRGNIVHETADILVNAANGRLLNGGGVAGALDEASEGKLQKFCNKYMEKKRKYQEIAVGEVAVTHAGGNLKCNHVIHAVGPDAKEYSPAACEQLVNQVVHNTLHAAEARNSVSIVFPAISCGIFGVNNDMVARCMIDTILGYNYTKPAPALSDIRIVILNESTYSCFARYLKQKTGLANSTTAEGPLEKRKTTEPTPEEIKLSLNDMSWIMTILRRAAHKSKEILMAIGIKSDAIQSMREKCRDEVVVLNMGMSRWLKQEEEATSPGVTLADLATALNNSNVGEELLATEIVKTGLMRKWTGKPLEESTSSSSTDHGKAGMKSETKTITPREDSEEACAICLEDIKSPKKTKCSHTFCKKCIERALEYDPCCPSCRTPLRAVTGRQPRGGTMIHNVLEDSLPGYGAYKTIQIDYSIPGGVQDPKHPNPGHPYTGTSRTAYLPYSEEGWKVFKLLEKAFKARMIFTVGTSVTTGVQDVVVWNDIHHKTNISGGPQNYGYPDPTYLQRVTADLAAKGILPDFDS